MSAVIALEHAARHYPHPAGVVHALRDASLEIGHGEFVAVSGPSGSGKSTLLNLAALLDRASSGSVRFDGRAVSGMSEAELCERRRDAIGVVFQSGHLLPNWSALDNVAFRFRYHALPASRARRLAAAALARVGLASLAAREARLLSGGEAQRVALARAIVNRPLLLAADEPTGNLDSEAAATVLDCLRELRQDGIAVLLVTHDAALAAAADRRLLCRDGQLPGLAA